MSDYVILNGELYHYGIKGMKWGVRRFQNKDGSTTAAGRARRKGHFNDDGTLTSDGKKFYENKANRHGKRGNEFEELFLRTYEQGDMTADRTRREELYKKATEYEQAAYKEYAQAEKIRDFIRNHE